MTAAPRLTSAMLVASLCRQVQSAGGFAAVLRHGDDRAGAILIECVDRGQSAMLLERASDAQGRDGWRSAGPVHPDPLHRQEMLEKRVRSDPDLWVVELDVANVERFIAALTN